MLQNHGSGYWPGRGGGRGPEARVHSLLQVGEGAEGAVSERYRQKYRVVSFTAVLAGDETRGNTWRVMFVLLVIACIVGLAMIVVSWILG